MSNFCVSPSLPPKSAFSNDLKTKEDQETEIVTAPEGFALDTEKQGETN